MAEERVRQVRAAFRATRDTIAKELENQSESAKGLQDVACIRTFDQLVEIINKEDSDEDVFHVFCPECPR